MVRIHLIRHGKAAAGWGADPDPGLDAVGQAQARAVAEELAAMGPLPILVSPLRRTRETAAPLEARWNMAGLVEPAVAEIPSPTDDLTERAAWLQGVMARRWDEVDAWLRPWRQGVLDRLLAIGEETVVVTHFIAINVAVGAATGDDRVVCFSPDNGSRTVLEAAGGRLRLASLGRQAATVVRQAVPASRPLPARFAHILSRLRERVGVRAPPKAAGKPRRS